MKIKKSILLIAMVLTSNAVFAYSPEEQQKQCHKPKFTDFTLTEYKASENNETPAEAEFSFKVPAWTNPDSIKLNAKQKPLPFTLESNSSFHKVNAKIPAEFTGKFLRLDVSAKVIDGECYEVTGWLLKIADKSAVASASQTSATESATTPAPQASAPTTEPATTPAPAPQASAPTTEPATTTPAPVPQASTFATESATTTPAPVPQASTPATESATTTPAPVPQASTPATESATTTPAPAPVVCPPATQQVTANPAPAPVAQQ